jgi:hypothetical protein
MEFVDVDLKVINGAFGKCIGLNISIPKIVTKHNAIVGSP